MYSSFSRSIFQSFNLNKLIFASGTTSLFHGTTEKKSAKQNKTHSLISWNIFLPEVRVAKLFICPELPCQYKPFPSLQLSSGHFDCSDTDTDGACRGEATQTEACHIKPCPSEYRAQFVVAKLPTNHLAPS